MTKTKTRLGSFYTEFELSRVELRVTRLTREFRVLVPGLLPIPVETRITGLATTIAQVVE
jgi:hypothetical protein